MTLLEAARKALEALEWNYNTDLDNIPACEQWAKMLQENITALRQAIEQAEQQEPVAWRYRMPVEDGHWVWNYSAYIDDPKDPRCEPLYTTPPQRKPLTDEEIDRVTDQQWASNNHKPIYAAHRVYARAIERAHGITGDNT